MNSPEIELVTASMAGDREAFRRLVDRYFDRLSKLIRYRIGDVTNAEDVLQETLILAWVNVGGLRDASRFAPWLYRIAGNECRRHHRSSRGREVSADPQQIELLMDRGGRGARDRFEDRIDIRESVRSIPAHMGEIVELYYLKGFSIKEISRILGRSDGTVKRLLHDGRNALRAQLEIRREPGKYRRLSMREGTMELPERLPKVAIERIDVEPFAVDSRELRWWFGVPELNGETLWGIYDPPSWRLADATRMRPVAAATVHGVEGVELEVDVWTKDGGWTERRWEMCGTVAEETVRWLSVKNNRDSKRSWQTFLDETFEQDWGGEASRRIVDDGRYVEQEPDVFGFGSGVSLGAGYFRVKIGRHTHECIRALEVVGGTVDKSAILSEAYIDRNGRTVYWRRYNGLRWGVRDQGSADTKPWDERFPDHRRIRINGVTFVHWYDCLTHYSQSPD